MNNVTLSATPKGNGFQAVVTFSGDTAAGVGFSSAETYPTIADAITAAAIKLLGMPDRLMALNEKIVLHPTVLAEEQS